MSGNATTENPQTKDAVAVSLEKIKIFREFARYYYSVRNSITYVNIIAAGAFTYFFVKPFIDPANAQPALYVDFLAKNYWLYAMGCIAYVGIAAFATAFCNLLSNSFYGYMLLTLKEEAGIGIDYSMARKPWAVTFEFLDGPIYLRGPGLQGNPWNTLNTFLAMGGTYSLVLVSAMTMREVALGRTILYCLAVGSLLGILFFILAMSIRLWVIVWPVWLGIAGAIAVTICIAWTGSPVGWQTNFWILTGAAAAFVATIGGYLTSQWKLRLIELPICKASLAIPEREGSEVTKQSLADSFS